MRGIDKTLGSTSKPSLADELCELFKSYVVKLHQNCRVSIEVRRREVNVRITCEQSFFHFKAVGAHSQDRPGGRVIAQRFQI